MAPPRDNDALVRELELKGAITTPLVANILREVDRSDFATYSPYLDAPQSIGYGATISAPYMHAQALERLAPAIKPDSRILDVGCGSGILTLCFAKIVGPNGRVIGIDHISELVENAETNIRKHNADFLDSGKILLVTGDGRLGYPKYGPYDAIHVGAAAPDLPRNLIEQLSPGGRMIIPVGTDEQDFLQVDKQIDGSITSKRLFGVIYVPLTSRDHQLRRAT